MVKKVDMILTANFGDALKDYCVEPIYHSLIEATQQDMQGRLICTLLSLPPIKRHSFRVINAAFDLVLAGADIGVLQILFENLDEMEANDWKGVRLTKRWEELLYAVSSGLFDHRSDMLSYFLKYYERNIVWNESQVYCKYRNHCRYIQHASTILFKKRKLQEYLILADYAFAFDLPTSEQMYMDRHTALKTALSFFTLNKPQMCGLLHYLYAVFEARSLLAIRNGMLELSLHTDEYLSPEMRPLNVLLKEADKRELNRVPYVESFDEIDAYSTPYCSRETIEASFKTHLYDACKAGFLPAHRYYMDLKNYEPGLICFLPDYFLDDTKDILACAVTYSYDCILNV